MKSHTALCTIGKIVRAHMSIMRQARATVMQISAVFWGICGSSGSLDCVLAKLFANSAKLKKENKVTIRSCFLAGKLDVSCLYVLLV